MSNRSKWLAVVGPIVFASLGACAAPEPQRTEIRILTATEVFGVSAVDAVKADGYAVTSAVCEVIAPISYRRQDHVFGGQLVFHAFRVRAPRKTEEALVLYASNHTASGGSGLAIPVNSEAIGLQQGLPPGGSLADPITVDTPGADVALSCARQAAKPPILAFNDFDVEAWRKRAVKEFGREQTYSDGSKDDYVRLALSLCRQGGAEEASMRAALGKGYEGSMQQFVLRTFCPHL